MSSGCGFSPAAPIISDWHVDDWMERMQRMIPAKKPHFGNSPEGGNPDSRLDITPTANYAERKNSL
ncbi:MAG: hypothetical protein NTX52_01905, partial [Planctomycetota bacterium]|nr:hypothetical protein [Planctomycetota bacterium]